MKTTRYDGSNIRRILSALVTDQVVCSRIASQWVSEGLFDSSWANLIGGWCVEHMKRYNRPPRERLRTRFEKWADSKRADEKTVDAVESFLAYLSKEHVQNGSDDSQWVLDLAGEYFNKVKMKKTFEEGLLDLEQGDVDRADKRLAELRRVELGVGSFVEPAADFSVWEQAFTRERTKSLVTYPGACGAYLRGSFQRGEFYAFLAPDKMGKTVNLIDFTCRAIRKRNIVAYFECGDGDQDEVLNRLGIRLTGCPEFSGRLAFPSGWNEDGKVAATYRDRDSVDSIDAFREIRRLARREDAFRLSSHISGGINVAGIDAILEEWARGGFYPDCICIDYADILAPPAGYKDKIEQIDETWKQLRRLSQKRHCLVMTATQANAGSYKKGPNEFLTRDNFSGSKAKNAHVNGILGINVCEQEQEQQMARWKWVVRRKQKHQNKKPFVRVAGNYDIGNPVIVSSFQKIEKK